MPVKWTGLSQPCSDLLLTNLYCLSGMTSQIRAGVSEMLIIFIVARHYEAVNTSVSLSASQKLCWLGFFLRVPLLISERGPENLHRLEREDSPTGHLRTTDTICLP